MIKTLLDIPVFGGLISLLGLLCNLIKTLLFREISNFWFFQIFINWVHSKSMLARNFQFLTPSPFVHPRSFYMYTHQRMFVLVSYPSQRNFHDTYDFLNEKSGSKKREKN